MRPALAGAGANGGISVVGGTVEVGAILTGQQLLGLAQDIGLTGMGSIMFVASVSPSPQNPSGVAGARGTYNRRNELSRTENSRLRNAINELYRPTASTGDGGSAAKLVEEVENSILNKNGKYPHYQKVMDKITELLKIIKEENLTASDEKILRELLNDLYNALKYAN